MALVEPPSNTAIHNQGDGHEHTSHKETGRHACQHDDVQDVVWDIQSIWVVASEQSHTR